jgi:hypothetical protein
MASVAAVSANQRFLFQCPSFVKSLPDEVRSTSGMAMHKFRVGEKVQSLAGQGVRFGTVEVFEIVQQLPERDGECQYKIKSLDEPHLRVAKEYQLRRV